MSPRGLLIAYEEDDPRQVKPVISDLDCLVVGSHSVEYEPLPTQQVELVKWSIGNIEALLEEAAAEEKAHGIAGVRPWMKGWFGRLKREAEMGHRAPLGTGSIGYGDPTSCHIISRAIEWTKRIGAVRHGAEAFNYHFPQVDQASCLRRTHTSRTTQLFSPPQMTVGSPDLLCPPFSQDLDTLYLVTWDGFPGLKWRFRHRYHTECATSALHATLSIPSPRYPPQVP